MIKFFFLKNYLCQITKPNHRSDILSYSQSWPFVQSVCFRLAVLGHLRVLSATHNIFLSEFRPTYKQGWVSEEGKVGIEYNERVSDLCCDYRYYKKTRSSQDSWPLSIIRVGARWHSFSCVNLVAVTYLEFRYSFKWYIIKLGCTKYLWKVLSCGLQL